MYQPGAAGSSSAAVELEDLTLSVWLVPRGVDLALLTRAALDEIEPPDLRVQVVEETADAITVEVIDGIAPYADALMLVERHGSFEVLHREVSPGERAPRVRLTLAPFPTRGPAARR